MATIYCHINKINNKKYIGISDSIAERRWGKEGINYKGSLFFEKGILPNGWDNFIHLILNDDISFDLAEQVEARLIKKFDTTNIENGYNESNGARIIQNDIADTLTNQCYNIISNANKNTFKREIPPVDYYYDSPRYSIDYLVELERKQCINTDLDCQRGYVWTPERQQGMWDTLLRGHRIPECHAIQYTKNGMPHYDIIDGKQRLTTIMNIIKNIIPFQKRGAEEKYRWLFGDNTLIYFKDLPTELQNRILSTNINFAVYMNLSEEDMIALFRKLNASAPLSEFSKGIASNILIRTKFTRYLTKHPLIKSIFSEGEQMKSEDELFLVRLALLLEHGAGAVSLQPKEISKNYDTLSSIKLSNFVNIISKSLDKYSACAEVIKNLSARGSFLPIIFYYFIINNIDEKEALSFLEIFKDSVPSVRGEDFNKKIQLKRLEIVSEYFNF